MARLQNNYGNLSERPAAAGALLSTPGAEDIFSRTAGSPSPKIAVVTVDTAVNATTYAYTFEGVVVSYLSDASATKPEIADGLAAAHNAALLADGKTAMSIAIAESDGVDAVTITSRQLDYDFAISETDANLSLVITALDPGVFMEFGIGVDDGADFISAELHATGGPFLGVVKRFQRRELYSTQGQNAELGRVLDIVTQGVIWVLLDAGQSPAVTDSVFCRHTAAGSEVQGAFRVDVDGGDADAISGAEWVGKSATDINGNNVALLRLI